MPGIWAARCLPAMRPGPSLSGNADELIQLATATVHDREASDPARARSPGICLLSLPFHTWAVVALAGVSALAVMPLGRPEDAITATAVPA